MPTNEKELEEWKREVAIKHVKRISGQIGLKRQVPKVIFNVEELNETMKELIEKHEVPDWHKECGGAYFPHVHIIYLNVSSFGGGRLGSPSGEFMVDLKETVSHELAHARFPNLPLHGDEFEKRVRQILNGKRFPSIILSLPKIDDKNLSDY